MGKGSNKGSTTTVQKAEPWAGAQPGLANLYSQATNWFNSGQGSNYYPGQLSANTPQDLNTSFGQISSLANSGSPVLGAANQAVNWLALGGDMPFNPYATGEALRNDPTAGGAFLGKSNPYLPQMVEAANRSTTDEFMNSIAPSLASQFSAAGRLGSGANIQAFGNASSQLAKRLGDTASNIYGSAYESERNRMAQANQYLQGLQSQSINDIRNRQLQASGLAPALEQARFIAPNQLMQSGAMQRQLEQDAIDREVQRYQYNAEAPQRRLQAYSGVMNGAAPYATQSSSGTQQAPYNRLTGAIGGGLGAYALGNALGAGLGAPFAAGGALLGLFG